MDARLLEAEDVRLNAFVRPGASPRLILLHGAGGNGLWWKAVVRELDDHEVVAVDMPGHGGSPLPDDWHLQGIAERIAGAVNASFAGPSIWGGHSWGGKVATLVCAMHSEAVAGLALIDPSPIPASPELAKAADATVEATFGPELGPWGSLGEAVAAARQLPQYRNWDEDMRLAFKYGLQQDEGGRLSARVSRETLVEITRATFGEDHTSAAAELHGPTLLVASEESLPWQEATNFPSFPDAERSVLPGNHWIHVDRPRELGQTVAAWLRRVRSDAPPSG